MKRSAGSSQRFRITLVALVVPLALVGGVWLHGQQPPLLDQADVQALVDFCMSPTGEKILQPPESTIDRAAFCAGIPLGPGLVLAGMVRNVQMLDLTMLGLNNHETRLVTIEADITQIQADIAALQAQSSATLQPQIDGIKEKLANMALALQ